MKACNDTYATPVPQLPPLVGIASFEHAVKPGLSVEECVKRLKRFHYSLWRIHQNCIAHIAEEPLYELKMAIRKAMRECYAQVGNPFMVNAGCEIPSRTPVDNLHALCEPVPYQP